MKPAVGQRWHASAGYDYDIIGVHSDGKRLLISCPEDGYRSSWTPSVIEGDSYLGPTPSPEAPAPSAPRLPSPAVGAGANRSWCKPWCGGRYDDNRAPLSWTGESFIALEGGQNFPLGVWLGQPCWCTALCRDERRPPIDSQVLKADGRGARGALPDVSPTTPLKKASPTTQPGEVARSAPSASPANVGTRGSAKYPEAERIKMVRYLEGGPSAVAAAPERVRDTFVPSVSEYDLLPDVRR